MYIEESVSRGLQWTVFEPNGEQLWEQIRRSIGDFMMNLFQSRAFQGTTPDQAYFVKCGRETMTADDIANGVVNIEVGFAPMRPAEFVIIRWRIPCGQ